MSRPERRHAPRIASQIPLILNHEIGELAAKTENISTSGAYCTLSEFLPPMTRLEIRLELPDRATRTLIRCQGVVVRVQPPAKAPTPQTYSTAIFFNELSDHNRALLARYIHERLPVATSPR